MASTARAKLFDETPADLGRLVLLTYALVVPPYLALLLLAALPGRRLAGSLAVLALAAAGAAWIGWRGSSPRPRWELPGALLPAAAALAAHAATGRELLALVLLAALVPWTAALFEARVVAVAWAAALLACLLALLPGRGGGAAAVQALAFGLFQAVLGFVIHGKASFGRQALLRMRAQQLNDVELVIRPDGVVAAANDRAAEAYGYAREELVGMDIRALRSPGSAEQVQAQLAEAAAGGAVFEAEHRRRDGSTFPVEVSARPFTMGGRRYLHSLVRDTTARRRSEARHRFLSTLVASMQEGVVTLDRDGRIETWSGGAERILGWAAEEVLGRSPFELLVPAEEAPDARRAFEQVAASGEAELVVRLRRKDGEPRVASLGLVRLHGRDGAPTGVLAVLRDVTVQHAAEAALREGERRLAEALTQVRAEVRQREQILAVVAHDLRSPLAAIALSAHALERLAAQPDAAEALAERRRIIVSAAQRMGRLVEDLLDAAAIREGKLRLRPGLHAPGALAREALAQAAPVAEARQVALALADDLPGPALLPCDRGRVLQVLGNLLSNALQATPAGGTITLGLAPTPGAIQFSVRDTGPGLPPDLAPRLFEPYQRGGDARYKGAGLGLAISRGIVEGHGGRIWAATAGSGADLRFTLPCPPAERATPCAPSPS